MSARVLVSTHDLRLAGRLREGFRGAGYDVELVTPDEEVVVGGDAPDLLVLTGGAGTSQAEGLLEQARGRLDVPVIGYGPGGGVPGLAETFGAGTPPDDVVVVGRSLVERRRLQRVTGIVGETDAMREVMERVVQIAPVASTVLVTGESGTGKELIARGIHHLSPRRHKPFIAVNVAALPDTLLESELFGHEKGAFTGAIDARRGFFELADGGTIFLDEIGEMPLATQTKLLRVLEQREFLRVGGEKPIRVDIRVVAATNQALRQLVALGDFRRDLYYRLNVLRIELPPLRERTADIPLLVREFIEEASARNDRPFVGIEPEAMEILRRHRWPGNVRELRNLVESMVVLAPGRRIRASDIPPEVRGDASGGPSLLPAPARGPSRGDGGEGPGLRPQLEFVFRTLVEMRVDLDDLRRDFEAYRERGGGAFPAGSTLGILPPPERGPPERREPPRTEGLEVLDVDARPAGDEVDAEEGVVVYRPGMTMEEMEREAIAAALGEVGGNRRKAAEMLGIGERTLYRKIKRYDLEV